MKLSIANRRSFLLELKACADRDIENFIHSAYPHQPEKKGADSKNKRSPLRVLI